MKRESGALSVLALSSRFDGPGITVQITRWDIFQYSLCRVVLMVERVLFVELKTEKLSVLALSSRFDGP